MRPNILAAILVIGAAAVAAGAWFVGWPGGPREPSDPFAERFLDPTPPSAALQRYAARLLFDGALAFGPRFVEAPRSVEALAPHNMTGRDGLALAFTLPAQPLLPIPEGPAVLDGSGPSPLTHVPLPPSRPKVIIDNDRVIDDDAIAKLKQRLRLNASQERLWLPTEEALRSLVYLRPSGRNGNASLDIAALQRLKAASDKLMEALREDQKREVKLLMGIVGF